MLAQLEAIELELKGLKLDQEKTNNRLKIISADLTRLREKLL